MHGAIELECYGRLRPFAIEDGARVSHSLHLKWGRCAAQGIALAVLLLSGIHDCAAQNNRADTLEHGGQAIGAGVASLWLPEIARIMQRLEREVTFQIGKASGRER